MKLPSEGNLVELRDLVLRLATDAAWVPLNIQIKLAKRKYMPPDELLGVLEKISSGLEEMKKDAGAFSKYEPVLDFVELANAGGEPIKWGRDTYSSAHRAAAIEMERASRLRILPAGKFAPLLRADVDEGVTILCGLVPLADGLSGINARIRLEHNNAIRFLELQNKSGESNRGKNGRPNLGRWTMPRDNSWDAFQIRGEDDETKRINAEVLADVKAMWVERAAKLGIQNFDWPNDIHFAELEAAVRQYVVLQPNEFDKLRPDKLIGFVNLAIKRCESASATPVRVKSDGTITAKPVEPEPDGPRTTKGFIWGGKLFDLEAKATKLLRTLWPAGIKTDEQMIESVWGTNSDTTGSAIKSACARARNVLVEAGAPFSLRQKEGSIILERTK